MRECRVMIFIILDVTLSCNSDLNDLAVESIPGCNVVDYSVISQFTFQSDVVREDSTVGGVYQEIVNDADLEIFQGSYCKLQNKYVILILSKCFLRYKSIFVLKQGGLIITLNLIFLSSSQS